jgi:hypothetical protein
MVRCRYLDPDPLLLQNEVNASTNPKFHALNEAIVQLVRPSSSLILLCRWLSALIVLPSFSTLCARSSLLVFHFISLPLPSPPRSSLLLPSLHSLQHILRNVSSLVPRCPASFLFISYLLPTSDRSTTTTLSPSFPSIQQTIPPSTLSYHIWTTRCSTVRMRSRRCRRRWTKGTLAIYDSSFQASPTGNAEQTGPRTDSYLEADSHTFFAASASTERETWAESTFIVRKKASRRVEDPSCSLSSSRCIDVRRWAILIAGVRAIVCKPC